MKGRPTIEVSAESYDALKRENAELKRKAERVCGCGGAHFCASEVLDFVDTVRHLLAAATDYGANSTEVGNGRWHDMMIAIHRVEHEIDKVRPWGDN